MKIKLELFVEEVNLILHSLGNMPYSQVSRMVEKIHTLAGPQIEGVSQNTPPVAAVAEEIPQEKK